MDNSHEGRVRFEADLTIVVRVSVAGAYGYGKDQNKLMVSETISTLFLNSATVLYYTQ